MRIEPELDIKASINAMHVLSAAGGAKPFSCEPVRALRINCELAGQNRRGNGNAHRADIDAVTYRLIARDLGRTCAVPALV